MWVTPLPALLVGSGSTGLTGPAAIPRSMLLVSVSAKLMAEVFERLNQPGIVGGIFAGRLRGPSVFAWLGAPGVLGALARLGARVLVFRVGVVGVAWGLGACGGASR